MEVFKEPIVSELKALQQEKTQLEKVMLACVDVHVGIWCCWYTYIVYSGSYRNVLTVSVVTIVL